MCFTSYVSLLFLLVKVHLLYRVVSLPSQKRHVILNFTSLSVSFCSFLGFLVIMSRPCVFRFALFSMTCCKHCDNHSTNSKIITLSLLSHKGRSCCSYVNIAYLPQIPLRFVKKLKTAERFYCQHSGEMSRHKNS